MSEEQIKNEYEKLLANESIQKVVNHGQFFENFRNLLTDLRGNYFKDAKIEVVPGNKIRISREGSYPEATNGIYKGVRNYDSIVISIEQIRDKSRLVFLHESAEIMGNPHDPQKDFGGSSRSVEIFDDSMKVAQGSIYFSENVAKGTHPQAQLFFKPELNLNAVANGMLEPLSTSNMHYNCFRESYSRMSNLPGVSYGENESYDCQKNSTEKYCRYYTIGREYPSEMRLEGDPIAYSVSKTEPGQTPVNIPMTTLGQYKEMTLSDALNQVNEYYTNVPYRRF